MTTINPRTRSQWFSAIGLAALLAICGCKSNNSDNGGRISDPLVSGPTRIAPQNVPVPDRGIGSNGKVDPLTASPTGKPPDRTGVGWTDDASRFKGTFIPGPGSMPAALTANAGRDSEELKIDGNENRVPLQQTGAITPAKPSEQNSAYDSLFRELEKYGCKSTDRSLTQENGEYVFRASVPRGINGAKLQCEGRANTAEDAIKKVLDDVIADRK